MHKHRRILCALFSALALWGASHADAGVTPASLFKDHMVLQRDTSVPVWGVADPGEKVSVEFAGQSASATADKDGKWSVSLAPLKVSVNGAEMTISGHNKIVLSDVLVGEVWICSGQSNMEFQLAGAKDAREEIAASDFPQIRMFTVVKAIASEEKSQCSGEWQLASPRTTGAFSAVGYFFARDLHKALGVPIGMIHTSWGGTPAQTWTPMSALKAMPEMSGGLEQLEKDIKNVDKLGLEKARAQSLKDYIDKRASWIQKTNESEPGIKEKWFDPAYDTSKWRDLDFPGIFNDDLHFYVGFVWARKDITIPKEWVGKELELGIGAIDECDITYVNGVEVGQQWYDTPNFWTAPRYYKVPASVVTSEKLSIGVRIFNAIGDIGPIGPAGTMHVRPVDSAGIPDAKPISLAGVWKVNPGVRLEAHQVPMPNQMPTEPGKNPGDPARLYNAMVAPLVPYAIKGAIWYQGEANAGEPEFYAKLLPVMISSWRKAFGREFAFGIVQLASFTAVQTTAIESSGWADLRDSQFHTTLVLKDTGIASASDIGEAGNIHPRNKQDVGKRLALWARVKVYGEKIEYVGPMYKSMKVDGAKVRVQFDHADGLVARDTPLIGFAIAGEDKIFHVAHGVVEGDCVVIESDKVAKPVAVRYAWANNPVANLYNAAGLPALPFKTDDWKRGEANPAPGEKLPVETTK